MPIEGDVFAIAKVLRQGSKVHEDSRDVGELLKTALRLELSKVGTGRVYTTYFWTDSGGTVRPGAKRPTPHQASAPGSPPAPDTYELMNSVDYEAKRNPVGTEVDVGSSAAHAPYQEFGTSKMEARPWFRTTINRLLPKALKIWADGIESRERQEARRLGGSG